MSKNVLGGFSLGYANIQGGQYIGTDSIMQSDNKVNLTTQLDSIEAFIAGGGGGGGSSLTGDIVIGTNSANTITVNSGSTTYSNNELIKLKDNTVASYRVQCNDVAATDLMIINTTNGNESMYLPLKYTEIGNVASGGVQIGDGTNAGSTNIYGLVSFKNPIDSTSYSNKLH